MAQQKGAGQSVNAHQNATSRTTGVTILLYLSSTKIENNNDGHLMQHLAVSIGPSPPPIPLITVSRNQLVVISHSQHCLINIDGRRRLNPPDSK